MMAYLLFILVMMKSDPTVFMTDCAAYKALTEWGLLPGVLCFLMVRLVIMFPCTIQAWTLDLFFALTIAARFLVRDVLVPEVLWANEFYIYFVCSQRVVLLFMQGSTWAAIATQITYTICSLCNIYYNYGFEQDHFIGETIALCVVLLMGRVFYNLSYSEAKATLEAKGVARSEATVHRLLSAMCDAVVRMGPDCIIRHPCPKLEALLLRSRTHSALQGTSFRDLVDSAERNRFDHFMTSMTSVTNSLPADNVTDLDDFACTFHFHMKDAVLVIA